MSSKSLLRAPPVPCGSCPYRRDVPSGVWAPHEYDKLPEYDKPTWAQPQAVFLCHQRDGCLCGGWLACHGPKELLATRLQHVLRHNIDPSVFEYTTDVPVFSSGAEARQHGVKDIESPDEKAKKMIAGLIRKL